MPWRPGGAADAVARQPADLLRDVGRDRRERVVVVGLEPHDARLLGGAEPDRERRPERDRHLAEDVTRVPLADDALDAVDELRRFDPPVEHGEERSLRALVRRVLARQQGDVRRRLREPLAVLRLERGEDRDRPDRRPP